MGSYPIGAFLDGESTPFDHGRTRVGDASGGRCSTSSVTTASRRCRGSGKGLIARVDGSGESLRHARDPAGTVGLDAAFVQRDVYDVAAVLDRSSDVVYTSRGF